MPEIIPDNANAAIKIGSEFVIIPSTTPTVTPEVVPTKTPFFQPKIKTSNMLIIVLICKPINSIFPKEVAAIDTINTAPIISSKENTFFLVI